MENGALSDDAAAKVTRQVEFYFSDGNLSNDAFLLRSVGENEDGLVSLAVICAFTRMRSHLQLTQTTPETIPKEVIAAVANVLKNSSFLKVSDDGLRVGRAVKMMKPEDIRIEVDARSLAVSPFSWKTTREEVEAFFEGNAKVLTVRLPRHHGVKAFSGYALVEFASPEEAQRVAAMGLNFKGADLKFHSKQEFEVIMAALRKPKDIDDYPRGVIVCVKLTKIEKTEENAQEERVQDDKGDKTEGEETPQTDGVSREDLKAAFAHYGSVKFVDFSKGDSEGYIRYETTEEVAKARTAAVISEDGGIVVKDQLATLEALEGDAERDYWRKVREQQTKRRENSAANRQNRDSRGRFGGKYDRKQRGKNAATGKRVTFDDNEDEPEPKQQRTE